MAKEKFCPECGEKVEDDERFCQNCDTRNTGRRTCQ